MLVLPVGEVSAVMASSAVCLTLLSGVMRWFRQAMHSPPLVDSAQVPPDTGSPSGPTGSHPSQSPVGEEWP